MSKLSTADCQNWLIQHKLEHIKAMYGDETDDTPENKTYYNEIITNASTPKKWKRMTKYNVGSDIDKGEKECAPGGYGGMNYCDHPMYAGGVVRTFYLEGTDHITFNLIEVNGQIVEAEDCSD